MGRENWFCAITSTFSKHLRVLVCCALLLGAYQAMAQVPEGFNYKAVLRDSAGNLLPNRPVTLQISLHAGGVGGPIIYQEIHTVTSQLDGIITVVTGGGNAIIGD